MYVNQGAHISPVVQPLRIGGGRVDAAMAHRVAEIVVPVGAVNAIALIEIHHVRYIGQIVAGAAHRLCGILHVDAILPQHGGRARQACRDRHPVDGRVPFVSDQLLISQINIDPALGA